MGEIKYIDADFVRFVYDDWQGKEQRQTLVFGDKVEVLGKVGPRSRIRAAELWDGTTEGTVEGEPFRDTGVLKFSMVDVQQGDGMVLETAPDADGNTKIVFIDGGDNKLFARHVAARFRHRRTSADDPLEVDLMLVTHGDGDHFKGLNDILKSEQLQRRRKRLFIHPTRVYHNGIVKGPSSMDDVKMLGRTVGDPDDLAIVELYDDPADKPEAERNRPFNSWVKSLATWEERGPIDKRRVAFGMKEKDLFGFLGDLKVEIQGPFPVKRKDPEDGKRKDALPFLHTPKKSSVLHLEDGTKPRRSPSASHTINGHSIALRLTYGNVRFSLGGDLNQESMQLMQDKLGDLSKLEAEIVKAPHHGSADFDYSALAAMKPVVSLISAGDEKATKEHIHPRATIMWALGNVARAEPKVGIVLCTEMAAFFAMKDYSHEREDLAKFFRRDDVGDFLEVDGDGRVAVADLAKFFGKNIYRREFDEKQALPHYFGFDRTNFGIINVRTDGERVLVFTWAGKKGMKEAYRFTVDDQHRVEFADDVVSI